MSRLLRSPVTSSLALLAAASVLALAHPSPLAGSGSPIPAGPTDRSVKLDLIRKLKHGPGILILGDSRGRHAEPSLLQRLTGHTGFNAAVTGGSAPDAWVFTRYTADLFPRERRRYIFFVSQGITGYIPDPRMEADPRGRHYLGEVATYLSTETVTPNPWQTDTHYRADGSIPGEARRPSAAQVERVRQKAAQMAARIAQYPPGAPQPDPARFELFEHLIAYMNSLGARPVIVLNPVYPTILAELQKFGDPLTTASLDYLHGLKSRHAFVVVNCQNIHTWGGTDYDWTNPTHVNTINMRRMLRYIVSHSDGALS
jgi:hypothetical protein